MSELTMLEAADYFGVDAKTGAVVQQIVEESPILNYAPIKTIRGAAYKYPQEESLGGITWRASGGSYIASSGMIRNELETLAEAGGEVFIDDQDIENNEGGDVGDLKGHKFQMKARAMGLFVSQYFFEGDKSVDPTGIDGMRRRLTGSQLVNAGTSAIVGATLTLQNVRDLIDCVAGKPDALFMNKKVRNKITALVDSQTGTARIDYTRDNFGSVQKYFDGIPIHVVERTDDASTFFEFDEDDGESHSDCTSIYAVKFGMDAVHLIAHGGTPNVKDFGEVEARPGHLGRIRWMWGLAIEHPRAAARLYHINDA